MKTRVNQIGIALYDNKPLLPANRWYEVTKNKEDYKNRFNLEMNFLGAFEPVKLRCSLYWPPSQLRRYDFWKKNQAIYDRWLARANHIQYEARAGRIKTHIPALIGIPSQNISFQGTKGRRFTWAVPVIPSLVIAVQEYTDNKRFWNITWLSAVEERTFILDASVDAQDVPNKKHSPSSIRVSKSYNQPGDIESGLFMETVQAKMGKKIDDDYEKFKKEITYLLLEVGTELSKMQANHMFNQHPEWAARMLQETD